MIWNDLGILSFPSINLIRCRWRYQQRHVIPLLPFEPLQNSSWSSSNFTILTRPFYKILSLIYQFRLLWLSLRIVNQTTIRWVGFKLKFSTKPWFVYNLPQLNSVVRRLNEANSITWVMFVEQTPWVRLRHQVPNLSVWKHQESLFTKRTNTEIPSPIM